MSGILEAKGHTNGARGRWLLLAGAAAGIALLAVGVLRTPTGNKPVAEQPAHSTPALNRGLLPPEAVARVNDRLITRKDFEQVLAREVEEGAVPDASTKRLILDRMIDEELRVQRAIELKLHLSDPRVRMDLASAVAEAAAVTAMQESTDESLLRAYFDRNRDYFARRGPLRMRRIWVAIVGGNLGEAFTRARTAMTRLREKQPFDVVKEITGRNDPRPIPDELMSPDRLIELIGRSVLNAALTLQPGEISDPIRTMDGFNVLQMLERRNHVNPSFEACREDVEAEYWAELVREALEANAAGLRKLAIIQRADFFQ